MKSIDLPVVYSKTYTLLFLLLLTFLGLADAGAKTVAPDKGQKNTTLEITKDTLQAKIEAINTREGLDDALKSKVLSSYQAAQDNLVNIESFKARIIDFNQALKQAPEQTKKLQKEIEQTLLKVSKQKTEDFTKIPTEELDQRLIIEKGKISTLDETMFNVRNGQAIIRKKLFMGRQDQTNQWPIAMICCLFSKL